MVATPRLKKRLSENKETKKATAGRPQYILAFLILLLTAGITVGREMLLTMRFDAGFLQIVLIAIVVSLLTAHRSILLIALVLSISFAVNLPDELLQDYGVNREILLGTLVAIILEPIVKRFFK
jgi:uncharacterized membrane protein